MKAIFTSRKKIWAAIRKIRQITPQDLAKETGLQRILFDHKSCLRRIFFHQDSGLQRICFLIFFELIILRCIWFQVSYFVYWFIGGENNLNFNIQSCSNPDFKQRQKQVL